MEQEFETGYSAVVDENETDEIESSENSESSEEKPLQVHLDKWLWAARFYKTLALARKAIQNGKINYNGQRSRSSDEITVGGLLRIQHGSLDKLVVITGLSTRRRSMKDAALLYQDITQHQEILRQVAASYQPSYPRARYPMSGGSQNSYRSTMNPNAPLPQAQATHQTGHHTGYQNNPNSEDNWQKPKKLVRFLRKPAHRLMPNTYVPTREKEVEVEVE